MSEPTRPVPDYHFHDWRYVPDTRRLSGPTGEVRLKPLSDRLLRQLLDAPGVVLGRDHLLGTVWTRREVNDEVLSRAIAELRAVLGDDAREPRYVETLPKGGYRWIAPVQRIVARQVDPPVPMPVADTPHGDRHQRLAVIATAAVALIAIGLIATSASTRRSGDDHATREHLAAHLLAARPIAADPRLEFDPRFDASGRVVHVRADAGTVGSELVLVDPASGAQRVLWLDTAALRKPAPSPDGAEIAVLRHVEGRCEVWCVALVDLHRTRLGDCAAGTGGGLEWVDSGDRLVFTAPAIDAAHAPGLVLLDRRDGTRHALTTPDVTEGAHVDPRVSADGRYIAYASKHGGEGQLWLADWPGLQARRPLLERLEPMSGHAFEPAGSTLWVAGDLTRYRALHRLRDGGPPELIGGRGAVSVDHAADGAVVWAEAAYDADIRIGRPGDPAWTVIARSNRFESQPEFSPDARRLALVSNRSGSESIIVADRAGGHERALALDARFRWVRPTWSARDDALIVTAYEDTATRLYRYRLDGDRPQWIGEAGDDAFHGTELVDRLVFLRGHGSDRSTLMQHRDGAGAAEDLGLGRVSAYRASARWLAWTTSSDQVLRVAPWPGLAPVREIPRVDAGLGEALALAGDTLAYVDQGRLWMLALPDGAPRDPGVDRVPDGNGPNLAMSAAGDVAVVTMASANIDLMFAPAEPATR